MIIKWVSCVLKQFILVKKSFKSYVTKGKIEENSANLTEPELKGLVDKFLNLLKRDYDLSRFWNNIKQIILKIMDWSEKDEDKY